MAEKAENNDIAEKADMTENPENDAKAENADTLEEAAPDEKVDMTDQAESKDVAQEDAPAEKIETNTKKWLVLRVASNKEDTVRETLVKKVKIEGLEDCIGRTLVPSERIKRIKGGQQRVQQRKLYPGYVFVEMDLEDDGSIPEKPWFMIKETAGVGDFIGAVGKPTPMRNHDVEKMLAQAEKPEDQPSLNIDFKKGHQVKIREGPFENFEGEVDEILPDKGVVRVIVTIFGRATPLELEYWQLEPA